MKKWLDYLPMFKKPQRILPMDWRFEHAEAKMNILKQGLQDALLFFKKNLRHNLILRRKLPWYVLLGNENVGKTSLLAMSGLGITSMANQPLLSATPTAYCDWWFTKNAAFIDIAGGLMMPEDPKNDSHWIWGKFLDLLHRHQQQHPISGLLLCIDLCDFQAKNRGQRQLQIDIIRHRIQTLSKNVHELPVYLIFTKCDQIIGFIDSFNSLSPEDCLQPFGITLPLRTAQQNLPQILEEQFNAFLQRINEQLISRLHQEHNLEKRANIKNFPLQLESQKRDILNLVTQLHSPKTNLGGIYFTSSLQDGKNADALTNLSHNFGLAALANIERLEYPPQKKAFFIHQPLQKIISNKIAQVKKIPAYLFLRAKHIYITLGILMAIFAILIVPSYFYNRTTLHQAQTILAKYQPPISGKNNDNSINNFLPMLNVLQQSMTETKHFANPFFSLAFPQTRNLHSSLNTAYRKALIEQFSPSLKLVLETQLKQTAGTNPRQLFSALKAYIMLSDTSYLDQEFVMSWFSNYWQTSLPNNLAAQKQLQQHLSFWLNQESSSFDSNPKLIELARQTLNSLPLAELTYLALLESFHETTDKENLTATTSPVSFIHPTPDLYTATLFNTIYKQEIPNLARRIVSGDDWVLNLKLPQSFAQPLITQLIDNVRHMYVQRYALFWQTQLLNIQVNKFKNLADASNFVTNFNTEQSPFIYLFNVAKNNLQPIADKPEANDALAIERGLRKLLLSTSQNESSQAAITNMSVYLKRISSAENASQAALIAAQQHMVTNNKDPITQLLVTAKSIPAPLDAWLNTVALNSWHTIMQSTQNYLNLMWITEALPEYNEHIKNRYPVFKNSKAEISLAEFTQFFGPSGAMDKFFKRYLSPFVDSSQLYWKWKYMDGERLNVPQNTLEMFNRAAIIQRMYFQGKQKTPLVKFSISPIALGLISENYNMHVEEQVINYPRDFKQLKRITWPSANESYASLEYVKGGEKKIFFKMTGPWAIFKLLAHANLKAAQNSQTYNLNINADGVPVTYTLYADEPINPFIPGILTGFRALDKL